MALSRALLSGRGVAARAAAPAPVRRSLRVRAEESTDVAKVEDAGEDEEPPAPLAVKTELPVLQTFNFPGGVQQTGWSSSAIAYLDPSLPGNYGFDPLGLSDPEGAGGFIAPSWLAYAEIIHARWAMLAIAGVVTPEYLGMMGVIPAETGVPWFLSGVIPPAGSFDYWCDPYSLFLGEMTLMGFAEIRRIQDYRKPGSMGEQYFLGLEAVLGGSGEPAYPGGQFFNMANFGADGLDDLKQKEIANGRLAMVGMLGVFVQALATGEGPVQNLYDHVADAGGNNILTTFGKMGVENTTFA